MATAHLKRDLHSSSFPRSISRFWNRQVVVVDIDIKPGSDPNSINCNNQKEVTAVAILTTDDFDATVVGRPA